MDNLSKKVKIFLLLSVIWLLLFFTIFENVDRFFFFLLVVLPLVIGWGIYWIKKK